MDSVIITKNGATTLSYMNFSGFVRNVEFGLMITIACCLVVGLGLG